MILERKPLSMAEASEYVEKGSETDVKGFIKKFVSIKPAEAKKLREKLVALDLLKIKEEHIAKVIDFLPETQEDINKIFNDVSLDEDEIKKISDIVKEFK